ncbi:hypothetical protein RI844_16205 [Thalassotalea fonticola]|uniref:Uncharacterized protein n=1 Tax=Thalassotalea fonticola TaxID=3065649 RepID=A0ABZ0GME7_9GAMM|nr:hypothetical protein RI844_16205 [Colwelliaceae bacterium S1-1]
MKKILISLSAGLVLGYGASTAVERSEIAKLEAENIKAKQQISALSEQLVVAQNQPKQAPPLLQRTKLRTLTNGSLNNTSRSKDQSGAQRKQATERMRAQQKQQVQQNANDLNNQKIKTTESGIVL